MDGENKKEWTAFRVWMHPERALYDLDNQDLMEGELTRRLEELEASLESERKEKARLEAEKTALRNDKDALESRINDQNSEIESLKEELADMKEEISGMREELKEQDEIDAQLEAFSRQLDKFEDLKRGYEKRIADLQARLKAATPTISGGETIWPQTIDMRDKPAELKTSSVDEQMMKSEAPRHRHEPLSDDWLMDLPDDIR